MGLSAAGGAARCATGTVVAMPERTRTTAVQAKTRSRFTYLPIPAHHTVRLMSLALNEPLALVRRRHAADVLPAEIHWGNGARQ